MTLTSIIGYIELLRTESFQDKAEYDRFIQNTFNKATHLKKLLDDLFEYTRLNAVNTQLDLKSVDLCQLLDQLLFEFEPLAQENGVHIEKNSAMLQSWFPWIVIKLHEPSTIFS